MSIIINLDVMLAKRKVRSKDLAMAVGITEQNLSLIKTGKIKGFRLATLEAICAQRLVRRICTNCKEEFNPTEEQLMELGLRTEDVEGRTFCYGKGCDFCNHTGYRGRLAIFEIMVLDDALRELIMKHASSNILRTEARERGMRTLRENGLMAIYEGVTSIEEVVKETMVEEMWSATPTTPPGSPASRTCSST